MTDLSKTFRVIYMYLVALISVIVFIIGAVNLIDTGLKTWVFPVDDYYYEDISMNCGKTLIAEEGRFDNTEECEVHYEAQKERNANNQRNRDLAFGVSMTIVSFPIWLFHLGMIRRDKKRK
ncbi:hypothetical protein HOE67_00940 [Candidatus Peregrinibacteria bacterium]|jgi:hypothetical protein|nr:hypothetical protein [Candidatus Peregrinibacteria bacterium]MBT4055653.1 hypothetical protein [Candidatus Peregrinibacteria bacterium]